MQLIDGYIVVAKTKWYRQSVARIRPCRRCDKLFPSTSLSERTCPACHKVLDGIRYRAATTSKETELKEYIGEIFDNDIIYRQGWAKKYDDMARMKASLSTLERLGQGGTETARHYSERVKEISDALFKKEKEREANTD